MVFTTIRIMLYSPFRPHLFSLQPFTWYVSTIMVPFFSDVLCRAAFFARLVPSSQQFLLPQAALLICFQIKKNTSFFLSVMLSMILLIIKTSPCKSAVAPQVIFTWENISNLIKTDLVPCVRSALLTCKERDFSCGVVEGIIQHLGIKASFWQRVTWKDNSHSHVCLIA